jgi:hypothetical protein
MESGNKTTANSEKNDARIIEGEILDVSPVKFATSEAEEETIVPGKIRAVNNAHQPISHAPKVQRITIETPNEKAERTNAAAQKIYLLLPFIFLTAALFGGLRLSAPANDFLFVRPALICLIFAAILMVLFFRARLITLENWFSESFSSVKNAANAAILISLFAASVQVFNALLPERGLPFWIIAFCFFWTLWNNLFAEFDVKKLLKSLGGLFGLAFVVKYLILANLTAPANESWLQGIWQNPGQETVTYLLDLPRFAAGTGYIQFFTLVFYLIGLFLLPNASAETVKK